VRAAVLGARGNLGRLVVAEAERRGIDVVPGGTDSDVPSVVSGADVVVVVFPASIADPASYPAQLQAVFAAASAAGVRRVVGLIGSAGALTAHGERLVDTDYFAETTRHFYQSVHVAWDVYRTCPLDWVAFVPAARMQIHLPARAAYRTRTDERLVTTDETSRRYFDVSQISYADCALAIVDELERPRFSRVFVSLGW
jgi:uncharacterized protein